MEFCPRCEDYCETRDKERNETYQINGSDITVPVMVEICECCGEEIGSDEKDQHIIDKVRSLTKEKMMNSEKEKTNSLLIQAYLALQEVQQTNGDVSISLDLAKRKLRGTSGLLFETGTTFSDILQRLENYNLINFDKDDMIEVLDRE